MTQEQAERLRFLEECLALFRDFNVMAGFAGDPPAPFFCVFDLFENASTVMQIVTQKNLPLLRDCLQNAPSAWGIPLWICKIRGMIPSPNFQVPKELAPLFATAGGAVTVQPFVESRLPRARYVDPAFSEGHSNLGPQFFVTPKTQHKPEDKE